MMAKSTARDSAAAIRNLWASEKYSDMTVVCEDHVFRVHRAIVCPRSLFFDRAINGEFKEGNSAQIDLEEQERPIVEAVLKYIYTGEYEDEPSTDIGKEDAQKSEAAGELDTYTLSRHRQRSTLSPHNPPPKLAMAKNPSALVFNTKMYIAADFFDIPALKTLATSKYKQKVTLNGNSPEFSEAAELLWQNTREADRELRDIVATTASQNIDTLLDRGEFAALLSNYGSFGLDVLKVQRGRSLVKLKIKGGNALGAITPRKGVLKGRYKKSGDYEQLVEDDENYRFVEFG